MTADERNGTPPAEPHAAAASRPFSPVRVAELVPYALFAALFLPHLTFVPIWDGREYADALVAAARFPPRLREFNFFGHPSMFFMLLVGLGQFLWSGSAVVLNLTNFAFGLVGIAAFRSIASRCFPGAKNRAENVLLTSVFAVFPIVVASELNLNPDTGVLVFSLLTTAFLLAGRYGWAAAAALVLIYSKETGILLYGLIVALYLLVFVRFEANPIRKQLSEVFRRTAGFAPLWAYGAIQLIDRMTGRGPARHWMGVRTWEIVDAFTTLTMEGFRARTLEQIWILNFGWIASTILVLALLFVLLRPLSPRKPAIVGVEWKPSVFVALLWIATGWALTRFPTYANPRYLLPVVPMLVIVFSISLRLLVSQRGARLSVMGAFLALAALSCVRTVDPVSKSVWGTFRFGDREMLAMTSVPHECCGFGRDQLEYDLEYTKFASLQDQVFGFIRPDAATPIVIDGAADWFLHGELDATTFRRSLHRPGTFRPRYLTTQSLDAASPRPRIVYFMAYPNVDNAASVDRLRREYRPVWVRNFVDDGYVLPVTKYELRPWVAAAPRAVLRER